MRRIYLQAHLALIPWFSLASTSFAFPLMEVTITDSPFKLSIPAHQSTQHVSVVSSIDFDQRTFTSVEEALTSISSVQSGMGGRVGYDEFSIRGFAQSYYQFKNGLRLDPGYLQQEELYGLSRIEVFKGPSSVEYGQIAPGGLINMVSKEPQKAPIRQLGWETGSFHAQRITADIGQSWGDQQQWRFRMPIVGSQKNDFQNYVFSNRQFIAPTLSYHASPQTQVTLYSLYQQDEFRRSVSVPFALATQVNRSIYLGNPSLPLFSRPQTQWGYAIEHRTPQGKLFKQRLRRTQYEFTGSSFFPLYDAQHPSEVFPGGGSFARQIDIWSIDNQFTQKLRTGSYEHTFMLGYDQTDYQAIKQSGRANTPALNFYSPNYPVLVAPIQLSQGSDQLGQQGIYGQYRIQYDQVWAFNLGLRHSRVTTDKRNGRGEQTVSQRLTRNTLSTGLIGLRTHGFSPYISYSQSFEPLTSWEPIFDGSPRPTVSDGQQRELGIKWKSTNQRHTAVMSIFDITRSNVYNAININQNYFSAASDQRNMGVEIETRSSWKNGVEWQNSYTWIDARVASTQRPSSSGAVGTRPFGIPEHTASTSLIVDGTLLNLPDYQWMMASRFVGDRSANLDGGNLPSYLVIDLGMSYQVNDQIQAYATAKNVTNEAYELGPYFGNVNFGAPQTWLAGVRVDIR